MARPWPVISHRFGELATKATQRFEVGVGPRKFPFPAQLLNYAQRATLFNFYEEVQGSFQSFLYNVPQPDGTFVQYTCIFEARPLTVSESPNGSSVVTFNLIEVPNPATAPEYSIASTCTRFPSSALSAALLSQVQQIIPLIHIRVRDTSVPDIYLSDRRCTVGGQLYLPRVLDMGEPGTNVLLSQNINGAAENVQFVFGNADGVMAALANDTDLKYTAIDLCLYHVNTGILWQFWLGFIQQFISDGTAKFPVNCSDGLFPVMQMYPANVASRTCWKTYNDGKFCPWAASGASAATVTANGGDPTSCDFTWNGTNGCLVHGMTPWFGGLPTVQQSANVADPNSGVFLDFGRNTVTDTSIISDTIWGNTIPEIWCNQQASALYAFYTTCLIVTIRQTPANGGGFLGTSLGAPGYLDALAVVGAPIGAFTIAPGFSGEVETTADGFSIVVAPLLDGVWPYGLTIANQGSSNESAVGSSAKGCRQITGADPDPAASGSPANNYYAGWPDAFALVDINLGEYPDPSLPVIPYAAGISFVQITIPAPNTVNPTAPVSHTLTVPIAQGMPGRTWNSSGVATWQIGLINPVWIAVNSYLRAIGMAPRIGDSSSTIAAQYAAAVGPDVVASAAICDTLVTPPLGSGTELQFQFQGALTTQKPFRDWLKEILHCCLGYSTFEFGVLNIGIRINASSTDAFTRGNMLYQSLHLEPADARFEQMTISYADVAYQFQANTGVYVDKTHAAYYGRPNSPLSAQAHLVGCSTLGQALQIATTETREEIGGVNFSEWRNLRKGTFRTTLLGLTSGIGKVISITDPGVAGMPGSGIPGMHGLCNVSGTILTFVSGDSWDDPGLVNKILLIEGIQTPITFTSELLMFVAEAPGNGNNIAWQVITADARIQTLKVFKDWSVEFGFQTVTDSMYNLDVGPMPLDVLPLPLPALFWPVPLSVWLPWQVQADAADALFPYEYTFDINENYQQLKDGTVQADLICTGKLPVNASSPGIAAPVIGQVAVNTSGGSGWITGGGALWRISICATDTNGLPGPASVIALVNVPAGSDLNEIVLSNIQWPAVGNLGGYVIFASLYDDTICAQQTGSLTGPGTNNSYTPTSITFTGNAPLSGWGMPNPNVATVIVKEKPLRHSGPAGVDVTSVSTNTIVSAELIDSHSSPVNWTGRACSVIGRPSGSTPFASFNIAAFDHTTGTLTLDRDPTGIVLAGDALVIRFKADDLTSTPTLVTAVDDAANQNVTVGYAGMTVNAEIGNLIRVIAGTGRGQLPSTITANTATGLSFQPALLMDNTSVWIVEGPTWQNTAPTTVVNQLSPSTASSLTLNTVNYIDQPVLIGSFLVDVNGKVSPEGDMAFREDWIYGATGTLSGGMTLVIPGTLAIG
ncbi:MAG TPA: hypothetical protein VK816_04870, partial [Jatrophihabitantaceae bacterium]|nr:hypothetical protein [Jatrophihabitantaceae bacterium]